MSAANPQLADLEAGGEVLVIFQGTDSYISPSLYASKQVNQKVVPTWNFVMVQARGCPSLHRNPEWLEEHVSALTDQMEKSLPDPWKVLDAPDPFIQARLRGIVGVSIPLTSLKGKFKLSQNRPEIDREGLVQGMAETKPELARLMEAHFPPGPKS